MHTTKRQCSAHGLIPWHSRRFCCPCFLKSVPKSDGDFRNVSIVETPLFGTLSAVFRVCHNVYFLKRPFCTYYNRKARKRIEISLSGLNYAFIIHAREFCQVVPAIRAFLIHTRSNTSTVPSLHISAALQLLRSTE